MKVSINLGEMLLQGLDDAKKACFQAEAKSEGLESISALIFKNPNVSNLTGAYYLLEDAGKCMEPALKERGYRLLCRDRGKVCLISGKYDDVGKKINKKLIEDLKKSVEKILGHYSEGWEKVSAASFPEFKRKLISHVVEKSDDFIKNDYPSITRELNNLEFVYLKASLPRTSHDLDFFVFVLNICPYYSVSSNSSSVTNNTTFFSRESYLGRDYIVMQAARKEDLSLFLMELRSQTRGFLAQWFYEPFCIPFQKAFSRRLY